MDYEDVALFSDEKKYVALIKSDADAERNYGAARRARFIWGPRIFTEQPVFRLFFLPFFRFLTPIAAVRGSLSCFLGSRAATSAKP